MGFEAVGVRVPDSDWIASVSSTHVGDDRLVVSSSRVAYPVRGRGGPPGTHASDGVHEDWGVWYRCLTATERLSCGGSWIPWLAGRIAAKVAVLATLGGLPVEMEALRGVEIAEGACALRREPCANSHPPVVVLGKAWEARAVPEVSIAHHGGEAVAVAMLREPA